MGAKSEPTRLNHLSACLWEGTGGDLLHLTGLKCGKSTQKSHTACSIAVSRSFSSCSVGFRLLLARSFQCTVCSCAANVSIRCVLSGQKPSFASARWVGHLRFSVADPAEIGVEDPAGEASNIVYALSFRDVSH